PFVGFTVLGPGGVGGAAFSRSGGAAPRGLRQSLPGAASTRIGEGLFPGNGGAILPLAQGARANRPDHGARQPTNRRSSSRAKPISVSPARRAGLRFLSQKLCSRA